MKKIFFIVILVIASSLLVLIYNINAKSTSQKEAEVYDNINNILSAAIDDEKMQFLSLAVALSNSRVVHDALLKQREEVDRRILAETIASFEVHLGKTIYAQAITTDFLVHARSWESYLSDVTLKLDRSDLKEVLRTKKAKSGIWAGIPVGIKASAPVLLGNNLLGILEVTTPFDTIVTKLRKYQIELIPLLDRSHIPPAHMNYKHFSKVGNDFVAVNKNSNVQLLRELRFMSPRAFTSLQQSDLMVYDDNHFISYPMLDGEGKKLGLFIAIVSKKNFDKFAGEQKSVIKSIFSMGSTKEDIYAFTKKKKETIFTDMGTGYMANANNLVEEKDRLAYEKAAKEKLMSMSKEELVDIILQRSRKKVISGEIR